MAQAFQTALPEPGKPRLLRPGEDTDLTGSVSHPNTSVIIRRPGDAEDDDRRDHRRRRPAAVLPAFADLDDEHGCRDPDGDGDAQQDGQCGARGRLSGPECLLQARPELEREAHDEGNRHQQRHDDTRRPVGHLCGLGGRRRGRPARDGSVEPVGTW